MALDVGGTVAELFSKRHGFNQAFEAEITIRQDAPHNLRGFVVQLAYDCGLRPSALRNLVCVVLRERPDQSNWSEFPNIDGEIQTLIDSCAWYRVYDVIERVSQFMLETPYSYEANKFEQELNSFFVDTGIGWKLANGQVEARGPEFFEETLVTAGGSLVSNGFSSARKEIHESLQDLSRRPTPDITGAIQHSMAALECVAREICKNRNATLGKILSNHRGLIPQPLDQAVEKMWGFASTYARHIQEGQVVTYEEAELVVGTAAIICNYLAKKGT